MCKIIVEVNKEDVINTLSELCSTLEYTGIEYSIKVDESEVKN